MVKMKKKRSHAKLSDGSRAMRSEYVSPTDPRLCFPISMDCPYKTVITGSNMLQITINDLRCFKINLIN